MNEVIVWGGFTLLVIIAYKLDQYRVNRPHTCFWKCVHCNRYKSGD